VGRRCDHGVARACASGQQCRGRAEDALVSHRLLGERVRRSERRDLTPAQASAATTFSFVVPANAAPTDRAFLNAVAYDLAGNQTAAAQVILPVSDTVPPQITSFTTPSGRLDMVPGQPASVTVTATDEIGVTRVVLSAAGAFTFSDSASTTLPLRFICGAGRQTAGTVTPRARLTPSGQPTLARV
jgi:hypothetical protein